MGFAPKLKIAQKIPALVIGSVVAMGTALCLAAILYSSAMLADTESKKLGTIAESRANELQTYLSLLETDLVLSAQNRATVNATKSFATTWSELGDDAGGQLRNAYIDNNPNKTGEKHLLDQADIGTSYDNVHGEYHPTFRAQLEQLGYYDIFLFDTDGNLIYSVFKELDYGTNFKSGGGEWSDTDLGNAFRGGLALNAGETTFLDFRPYGPSFGAAASFLATPVFDGKTRIGVLAFQLPVGRLDDYLNSKNGLGETGETIAVGNDLLMRNNSQFSEEPNVLATALEPSAVTAALNGEVDSGELAGYREGNFLFASAPMTFKNTTWAVLAVQDKSEAMQAIGSLRNTMMIVAGLLLTVIAAIGWRVSKSITRPMTNMTNTMRELARDNLEVEVAGTDRQDEIGSMARAVEIFQDNAIRVANLSVEEGERQSKLLARNAMMEKLQQSFAIVVGAAAAGDFSQRVEEDVADAELVKLSRVVNNLIDTVDRGVKETGEVLGALANTDLTKRVEGQFEGAFLQLKNDTNRVADRLNDVVGDLRTTSGELKAATSEILAGANDLSERTTRQAATIEETSAAMEQLAETVLENAKEANSASENAMEVRHTAEEGGEVMRQANEAMQRITDSSGKISNIIGMIDDIAFQTNLLALNASVEAARAGEAGKGFAVVAVEVRRLAQSAATASNDVKALVEQSVNEVSGGSKLVSQAASNLDRMLVSARNNNELMSSIADKSKSQASSIEEISTAVREMDETTQHNAALVEETNAAIEQTEGQAAQLDRIVDVFVTHEGGTRQLPIGANNEVPDELPVQAPVAGMQKRALKAAASFMSRGNAAIKNDDDWQQF